MKEKEREIRILAITEEGYDAGFRLAGCVTKVVKDERELLRLLDSLIEGGEYGVILVEETLYQRMDERKRKRYEELSFPLVVGLNLREEGRVDPEEHLGEIAKRTLGYRLKIK
ncbi:MAG: V-type ATP synthase subunit F [Candidatus Hydrothermales bacterium]